MSDLLNQASLVYIPSGYKEDKAYSVIPTDGSGDLTFARASDGTRVNSQGLVERVPWNLASDSNSFPFLTGITKTTGQNDPFGSTNGNLLTATGTGEHYAEPTSLTAIVGNAYTFSVYGKFVQGVNLALRTVFANGNSDISTIWNLSTGELVLNAGDHTNPTITSVGNGWYRCSITYTPASVPAFPLLFRLQMAVGTNLSFTATSGDGFLAYGAQINEGTLKPYFPTTDRQNVPRLDYSNGCPSLLLEPQRTNLLTYSEQFDNAAWTASGSNVTANNGISPSGLQDADLITYVSAGSRITQFNVITGTSLAISVYVKGVSGNGATLLVLDSTASSVKGDEYFAGNTFTPSSGAYSAKSESVGNGWYRISIVVPITSGNNNGVYLYTDSSSGSISGSSLLAWGFQAEVGSYPTSYIPTTSASVTRVKDVVNGAVDANLFNDNEGVLFVEFSALADTRDDEFRFLISDGTNNERVQIGLQSNNTLYFSVITSNSAVADFTTSLSSPSSNHKVAIRYKTNDFAAYVDGVQIGTDTSGATPSGLDRLDFYRTPNNNNYVEANVKETIYFSTALTNAELAALTTL